MTMTYCGRCGSANGTAARYCRSCGAELSNQAAFSTPSTPTGVEFAPRSTPPKEAKEKAPRRDKPKSDKTPSRERPQNKDAQPTAPEAPPTTAAPAEESSPAPPDPKASSERLRRLRASGPLLLEAAKKKQERFNQIIAESIEGMTPGKTEARQPTAPPSPPAAQNSAAQPTRPASTTAQDAGTKPAAPSATTASAAKTAPATPPATAPPLPAPSTAAAAPTIQPTPRRASGQLTLPSATRNTGSLSNVSPAAQQGPASVLVQASGLKTQSNMGSKLRLGLIAMAVVLAAAAYFLLRDRLVAPGRGPEVGRNLVRAEDQSAELMRAGERERAQGNFQAAIDYFRKALELIPNDAQALFQLAQTHAQMGQPDEALKTYQTLLRVAPEHLEARLQLAQIQRARGNWESAYKEYQRIIALNQNSLQAATALEAIEVQEGKKPAEVTVARAPRPRAVTQKAPPLPPIYAPQAQVSLLPQRMANATNIKPPTLNTGAEEKPADPRALADPHKKLGVRYFNIREYRAAINEFLAALRLTPNDKDLYYLLGSSYHGLGQQALAYDYYRRVDSGPYRDVAEAGARQTEKAAREEFKRREALRNELKNEAKEKAPSKGVLNNSLE